MLAFLAWAALAVPGRGLVAGVEGVAGCERQFKADPEDPEAARCFWRQADKQQASRQVRNLRVLYPQNLGLQMCTAVLEPYPPDRAEALSRSAAGGYFHSNAAGEVLARNILVISLLGQRRFDEAGREVKRETEAASTTSARLRDQYLTLATMSRASLLIASGNFEQAGLVLDEVPPGPLRDGSWFLRASQAHLFTGQLDKAWEECSHLAQPPFNHFFWAAGLFCEAQVLMVRTAELPGEANASQIEEKARAARWEAKVGGNPAIATLASWPLVMLAKEPGAARSEYLHCLETATEESAIRICDHALLRWQVSAARAISGAPADTLLGREVGGSISRAEGYGDLMRVAWRTRPFEAFVREAQNDLSEIERLRAQQPGSEIQTSLLAVWSDDYYWFSGRLLEHALEGGCAPCLELAFSVLERLRGRALYDSLIAAGAGAPAAQADAERLLALGQAIERVSKRRQNSSLPPSERENAESDLRAFAAEEALLRRHAAALSGVSAAAGFPIASGARAKSPGFATLPEVQRLLEPDQALLSFQIAPWKDWTGDFGGGSWLVVATRTALRFYRLGEMGRGDLRNGVAKLFEHRTHSQSWQATELYRQLLEPALAELPPAVKRLIVVPDDHLNRLPFAALRATSKSEPLVWRYQISIVPSATLWAHWRRTPQPPPAQHPALVLADPSPPTPAVQKTFQAGGIHLPTEPLPAARREAGALVQFLGWGCERRVGGAVSEAVLLDPRVALRSFSLVHFAAHSIVDDRDPRRSGIWLSPSAGHEGLLQAADIVKLRFDDRLVVLSTCSSNGGPFLRGEGVMSLAHAFFQARARTVLASLWPQADTDAQALLTGFYRHLAQGASVAAALRLAQLELLRQDQRLPPPAWAGMLVLGDGDLVPFPGGRHPWAPWWLAAGVATASMLALLRFFSVRARRAVLRHRSRRLG